MYVGLELGTPSVLMDEHFFDVLLSSYLWSLLIILPIAYGFIKYAVYITNIHLKFIFGQLWHRLFGHVHNTQV